MPTIPFQFPKGGVVGAAVIAGPGSSSNQIASADVVLGSGDQRAAVQALIDRVTAAGGGTIFVCKTTTMPLIGSPGLSIDSSKITIWGECQPDWGGYVHGADPTSWNGGIGLEGGNCAGFKAMASGYNLITIATPVSDGGESRHRGIKLANLYLLGSTSAPNVFNYTDTALKDTNASDNCVVERCFVQGFLNGFDVAWDTGNFENCVVQDIKGDAYTIAGVYNKIRPHLIFDIGGHGVIFKSGWGHEVGGGTVGDCQHAVYFKSASNNCRAIGVHCHNTYKGAIVTEGGYGHIINDNQIHSDAHWGSGSNGGIEIGATTGSQQITVTGNSLWCDSTRATIRYAVAFLNGSSGTCTANNPWGGGWNSSAATDTIYYNSAVSFGPVSGAPLGLNGQCTSSPVANTGPQVVTSVEWQGWYRADSTGTGVVSSLLDGSGKGRNLTVVSGTPTNTAAQINGHRAVVFNGSTDKLQTNSWPTGGTQPFTVVMVLKLANTTGFQTVLTGNGGDPSVFFHNSKINTWAGDAGGYTDNGPTTTPTSAHVYIIVFNGTSTSITVDGVTTSNIANVGTVAIQTALAMGANSNANEWSTATYAELAVGSGAMNATDIAATQATLKAFYGTP